MHKATESAPAWHGDSTRVATSDTACDRAKVNGNSCNEAAALALLPSPGFKYGQDVLLQKPGTCSDYSNTFLTDERTGMPKKCARSLQMPIMLNKHLETSATVEQELHFETSKMSGHLTSLTAALKRLKVAEFTIWTGITSFNLLFPSKKLFTINN